jgi:hypothetical protein
MARFKLCRFFTKTLIYIKRSLISIMAIIYTDKHRPTGRMQIHYTRLTLAPIVGGFVPKKIPPPSRNIEAGPDGREVGSVHNIIIIIIIPPLQKLYVANDHKSVCVSFRYVGVE